MNLFAALVLALAPPQAAPQTATAPFPASSPIAEGLDPARVKALDDLVIQLVDEGDIVGAEILVIKNGRTVHHGAHGMRDVEAGVPMEPGGVFCVRSMTKPLIGTSILMLMEDGAIKRKDSAAKYLPSFDTEASRGITIEQLLQHTSGLPLSMIMAEDPRKLVSLMEVVARGGAAGPVTEPGSTFEYSDQGTDTLTAIIESVTGAPAHRFVEERILGPLGMDSTACIMGNGHPLRERACSGYVGSPNNWNRFWSPEDEPLFPFFLGSQGLYSTAQDYAKFLAMWMKRGRGPDGRLLKPTSVRKALKPGPAERVGSTSFPALSTGYGSLMQLWSGEDPKKPGKTKVRVFGHTGSDGTHAWAFPDQDAMVLFFTQSRGTVSGLRVEEQLGSLLMGVAFDPIEAAPPLEPYLGYYREHEEDRYRAIVRTGNGLGLDILGKALVPMVYAGDDRWKLKPQPATVLEFDRNEAGEVTGYHIGDHEEFRFTPGEGLPSADELAARVAEVHGMGRLAEVGPIKITSHMDLVKMGKEGDVTSWVASAARWRTEESMEGASSAMARNGDQLRWSTNGEAAQTVEGPGAALLMGQSLAQRFGDWRLFGIDAQVIQRVNRDGGSLYLVRLGDTEGHGATLYIDVETGRIRRVDSLTFLPSVGQLGQSTAFEDFRDVEGMLIPHRSKLQLANPMIGDIIAEVKAIETGVDLPGDHFTLK